MRSLVLAGSLGALSLVVGGLGVATAANGGSLTLGHSNTATKTTTLKDHKGTPLSLVGKKSKPPLKVNSNKEIAHLNAALVDGQHAGSLRTSGSAGQFRHTGIALFPGNPLSTNFDSPTEVALTGTLSPGTYYVTGSAETVYNGTGSDQLACAIAPSAHPGDQLSTAVNTTTAYASESENTVLTVTTPEILGQYCYSGQSGGGYFLGGIYAIKIARSVPGSAPPS
jgi:hypothetical protein